jgi:hypothetical protein
VGRVQVIGWAYVTVGRTKDASLGSRNVGGARRGWGAPCNRPSALMRGRDKRKGTDLILFFAPGRCIDVATQQGHSAHPSPQ